MKSLTNPSTPEVRRNGDFASHLPKAWPLILSATAIAVLVSSAHWIGWRLPTVSPVPFTILGVAISIFLGFRNNTAYNRFWEARTLWGTHINSSRSFGRQVMTLVVADEAERRPFQEDVIMATIAYAHSFKNHLQNDDPLDGIESLMLPEEVEWLRTQENVPVAILQLIGRRLAWARVSGWISGGGTIILEGTLSDMTAVQGGCERIKNTPVPVTYAVLSRTIVTFFCMFLPFGIFDAVAWVTPVVTFLVSYAFFGLDALGDEVTEPFGHDPNDLPLERYSATIETNLRQMMSECTLPDHVQGGARPKIVQETSIY